MVLVMLVVVREGIVGGGSGCWSGGGNFLLLVVLLLAAEHLVDFWGLRSCFPVETTTRAGEKVKGESIDAVYLLHRQQSGHSAEASKERMESHLPNLSLSYAIHRRVDAAQKQSNWEL